MKKRILSFLLAVCAAASLLVLPAQGAAVTRFSDVSDQTTSTAVEVLRLMGVLDGYKDGTFRPDTQLTRAQFCKMAVYAMNGSSELGMHRTVTVFPDVKPSHWAAGYINMAAKGKNIIAGYPDGKFYPERKVTVGQAVTILLRMLAYKDENVGGVWPDSYMAMAQTIGLTEGIRAGGNDVLTRAQAARLFVNLLSVDKQEGGKLYTLSEETDLISLDGGSGTMKTSTESYTMVHPTDSSSLTGSRGRVVLADGKALTFLPNSTGTGIGSASAAVIIYADGSGAGLEALAGTTGYTIYKNGTPATVKDLRKNDVATYYPATNSILVCDARLSVYYEDCTPNPTNPTKITALGHEFQVLPTAQDSLAQFKPGQQMTLLLTADGQVAGAAKPEGTVRSNVVGVVEDGVVQLLCGTTMIPIQTEAAKDFESQVVRVSSIQKDRVNLSRATGNATGDLKVAERKLGGKKLTDNVTIYRDGKLITLNQLSASVVPNGQILYARTNWAGQVDLIVLRGALDDTTIYGRAFWTSSREEIYVKDENGKGPNDEGYIETTETLYTEALGVETPTRKVGPFKMKYNVQTGDYVAAKLNRNESGFSSMVKLTELKDVSNNAWIGDTAVTFGSRTYIVDPDTVLCYNRDTKDWVSLEKARDYADQANLYVQDGVVRVIEVKAASK
ncbi:S-layer homology domain-containing protein [uncultured Dysosmobacter sp.]|uniref:S-layer homology domain-containing protein n=1 Tax=uncultured Dysosmobacter sp. TaxID=2591384 RepID=UPI0026203AC1|nr:S-layer homology domain-containing protein [uncultured Dysosmobacter sp.]